LFDNQEITSQPLFYLFTAATILLSLGYIWGRRANRGIFTAAFEELKGILKPRDQQYTNIGGLTGYHANFLPNKSSVVRRADVTITLLPRQSWLWYPFSLLIRRFDRLFLVFEIHKSAFAPLAEAHLIEQRYSKLPGASIENREKLSREELSWGGLTYYLYYENEQMKDAILECKAILEEPRTLRHLALLPQRERLFIFMIPRKGSVEQVVRPVYDWFHKLLKKG
ncbi:MAG: hypothetical protein ACOC45_05830, partial [Alkalispirochaetaceae bacterium]